jgi:hypothetical protein
VRLAVRHEIARHDRRERQDVRHGLGDRRVRHGDQRLRHAGGVQGGDELHCARPPRDVPGEGTRQPDDQEVDDLLRREVRTESLLDVMTGLEERVPDKRETVLLGPDRAVRLGELVLPGHPERFAVDESSVEVPENGSEITHGPQRRSWAH